MNQNRNYCDQPNEFTDLGASEIFFMRNKVTQYQYVSVTIIFIQIYRECKMYQGVVTLGK